MNMANGQLKSGSALISAVRQLGPAEFEAFLAQVAKLRRSRTAATLSPSETRLLLQINRGVSHASSRRYTALVGKRRRRTLSDEERTELLELTNEFESRDAERAAALVKLAELRSVPVRVLMAHLGIKARPVHG
jgi:hypothetical protein